MFFIANNLKIWVYHERIYILGIDYLVLDVAVWNRYVLLLYDNKGCILYIPLDVKSKISSARWRNIQMANKFSKNDEAVSAVIGVILMVAITVILAAVIAAFVFGMGSSIKKTYTVSYTIERSTSATGGIIITNMGGPDVNKLTSISVTAAGSAALTVSGAIPVTTNTDLIVVGNSVTVTGTATPTHVIVTGKFNDGSVQVLSTADV